jgi:hypothetical protein
MPTCRFGEEIVAASQTLHGSGTFSEKSLRALLAHAESLDIRCSAETGSGASTLVLSNLAQRHIAFTVDSGSGSLTNVLNSPWFFKPPVEIVEGPTQITLPKYTFTEPLQFALIDGPHGYPFPDLEYYYLYPHIEVGGILVVDDTQIRTIRNLFDFLCADNMWDLIQTVENTAFFRRTSAPTFPTCGDGWWKQEYNKSAINPGAV